MVVEKLSDQDLLTEIAQKDEQASVRLAAVKKLLDHNFLLQIAK